MSSVGDRGLVSKEGKEENEQTGPVHSTEAAIAQGGQDEVSINLKIIRLPLLSGHCVCVCACMHTCVCVRVCVHT